MKRLFRIFELTKNEQRVVLIVVFALIAIAFVGYQRRVHDRPAQPHRRNRRKTVSDCSARRAR